MIGRPIIEEALRRNHEVIAVDPFPRPDSHQNPNLTIIQTDVYSVDRVVNWSEKPTPSSSLTILLSSNRTFSIPSSSFTRSYWKASRKRASRESSSSAKQGPCTSSRASCSWIPAPYRVTKPPASAMLGGFYLDVLKHEHDIDWVYFSPAADIVPAPLTGSYRLGENDLIVNPDGFSLISSGDYASALMDEIDAPVHHNERFTIGY